MLEALERANLFLVPLDDQRRWYRYHHLFADVLRAHLLEEQPGEVPELHRRAASGTPQPANRAGGPACPRPATSTGPPTSSSWPSGLCVGTGGRT